MLKKSEHLRKLVYAGKLFSIEFYVAETNNIPAEKFLNALPMNVQSKFASLFVRLGDIGKIWNEQKFKHLTGTNHIFEFKVDQNRILCFFFFGKRVILTHGFLKKSAKTPGEEIIRAETYKKDFERRLRI